MALVYAALDVGEAVGCPYFIENPVGVISTEWRKPDFLFHPHEYGGYLPEDDVHPRWPEYIMPRDAYTKKTCLWVGGGYVMPERRPVDPVIITQGQEGQRQTRGSVQWGKLGGKSEKTKQIRSETPRGFAQANFLRYGQQRMLTW